jgi:hypothetical protein
MKCLSIRQPWAGLIALGIKDVENRTWWRRYTGPVLIHAAKTRDQAADRIFLERMRDGTEVLPGDDAEAVALLGYRANYIMHAVTVKRQYITDQVYRGVLQATGCIIGEATIWKWQHSDYNRHQAPYPEGAGPYYSFWHMHDQWGAYLSDAQDFTWPIPCRGHLGLYDADPATGKRIRTGTEE